MNENSLLNRTEAFDFETLFGQRGFSDEERYFLYDFRHEIKWYFRYINEYLKNDELFYGTNSIEEVFARLNQHRIFFDTEEFLEYTRVLLDMSGHFYSNYFLYENKEFEKDINDILEAITRNSSKAINIAAFLKGTLQLVISLILFFRRKNSPISSFAHAGAKLSGTTWGTYIKRIFKTLKKNPKSVASKRIQTDINTLSSEVKKAACLAKYAYAGYTDNLVLFNIEPTTIIRDSWYNSNTALFDLGLGLKGAICTSDEFPLSIIISFSGTNGIDVTTWMENAVTDAIQLLIGPDLVYYAALGLLQEQVDNNRDKDIIVIGHSLGGGLMQFSSANVCLKGIQKLKGYGFNSAGLSTNSCYTFRCRDFVDRDISHLCLSTDYVSIWGQLIGKVFEIPTKISFAHGIDNFLIEFFSVVRECNV